MIPLLPSIIVWVLADKKDPVAAVMFKPRALRVKYSLAFSNIFSALPDLSNSSGLTLTP